MQSDSLPPEPPGKPKEQIGGRKLLKGEGLRLHTEVLENYGLQNSTRYTIDGKNFAKFVSDYRAGKAALILLSARVPQAQTLDPYSSLNYS